MAPGFLYRPACEVCGGEQAQVLLSTPFTDPKVWTFLHRYYQGRIQPEDVQGAPFEVAHCPRCGFLWQRHILDDEGMAALYSRWISPEESLAKRTEADAGLFARYAEEMQAIARHTGKPPHTTRVLDFGMGWGHWLQMARAFGFQATGVELSEQRLAYARNQGLEVTPNLDQLPLESFDFINAEQVFEHIPNPLETLRRLTQLLTPKGALRIAVPNAFRIPRQLANPRWQAAKDAIHPLEHINGFRHRSLQTLARQANLTPTHQPLLRTHRPDLRFHLVDHLKDHLRRRFGTGITFCRVGL